MHFGWLSVGFWGGFLRFVAEVVEKCFDFFIGFGGVLRVRAKDGKRLGRSGFHKQKIKLERPNTFPASPILHTKLKHFPQKALTGAVSYDIIINCISIFIL